MSTKNYSTPTKKYNQLLSAVHMVYRLVNSTYNLQELILRLTRLFCQFIKASSSVIFLLDPETKRVVLKGSFNNKINILETKKKDLAVISPQEKKVLMGYPIYEKHLLGLPLVADDIVGAVFTTRKRGEPPFSDFDREILSVVVEQSVTAIKNLQLNEQQQKIILSSIELIGRLLAKQMYATAGKDASVYFKIINQLGGKLRLNQDTMNNLYYASILRVAGAIDVPIEILTKKSQLTPEEFKIIRNQPLKGVEFIKPLEFLKPVLPIILYHHEKYDGTGYPSGLKKEQIPIGARIMAVVDSFEAMVSERPYKRKRGIKEAVDELKANSGTQFDPKVVSAFVELAKQKKFRGYLNSLM